MGKADRHQPDEEEDVVVERSSLARLAIAAALVIGLLVLLHYFKLLPI